MLKHIGINLTNVLLIKVDKITQIQTEIVYFERSSYVLTILPTNIQVIPTFRQNSEHVCLVQWLKPN